MTFTLNPLIGKKFISHFVKGMIIFMKKNSNYNITNIPGEEPKKTQIPLLPHFKLISLLVMIILPTVCSFGLNFLYTYYAGDIEHPILPVILNYTVKIISEFIPYAIFGILLWGSYRYGCKKIKFSIITSFIGILIPYLSLFLIEYILGSIKIYYRAYLMYSFLYIFDAAILAVIILLIPIFRKSSKKRKKNVNLKNNSLKFTYAEKKQPFKNKTDRKIQLPKTLLKAAAASSAIRLIIAVSTELYYTITFIYQLKNEYYRTIYTEELISIILHYGVQFLFAGLGFLLMYMEMKLGEKYFFKKKSEIKTEAG